jgi:hypothetical protein
MDCISGMCFWSVYFSLIESTLSLLSAMIEEHCNILLTTSSSLNFQVKWLQSWNAKVLIVSLSFCI